jgi:hypothetical protein
MTSFERNRRARANDARGVSGECAAITVARDLASSCGDAGWIYFGVLHIACVASNASVALTAACAPHGQTRKDGTDRETYV